MPATLVNRAATIQNRNPDPIWNALPSTIRTEARDSDPPSTTDGGVTDPVT
jgi:hypothetical protein